LNRREAEEVRRTCDRDLDSLRAGQNSRVEDNGWSRHRCEMRYSGVVKGRISSAEEVEYDASVVAFD